jgi:succinate dehydrogenase / fumarate reductase flavoprotein subunit
VGETRLAVYLDFADAIGRLGEPAVRAKYGNLFQMYAKITGEDPYKVPMRIYPALHYTMGGLWVDYDLMSNLPGLFVLGEANFSDHGANRLGASALMQGLADGYFVIPATIGGYLATAPKNTADQDHAAFADCEREFGQRVDRLMGIAGKQTADDIHKKLGQVLWDHCGMGRNEQGLKQALEQIPKIREEFWSDVTVTGTPGDLNVQLEKTLRVADFIEFGDLMVRDALERRESCGGHFREESQTEDNEAKRDDEHFSHVSVWEHQGADKAPILHKEPLSFEHVKPSQRSYK